MLSTVERTPLKHLRLAHYGVYSGVALALLGALLLLAGNFPGDAEIATVIMGAGIGLAFCSGYYWACGNNSCSPNDW